MCVQDCACRLLLSGKSISFSFTRILSRICWRYWMVTDKQSFSAAYPTSTTVTGVHFLGLAPYSAHCSELSEWDMLHHLGHCWVVCAAQAAQPSIKTEPREDSRMSSPSARPLPSAPPQSPAREGSLPALPLAIPKSPNRTGRWSKNDLWHSPHNEGRNLPPLHSRERRQNSDMAPVLFQSHPPWLCLWGWETAKCQDNVITSCSLKLFAGGTGAEISGGKMAQDLSEILWVAVLESSGPLQVIHGEDAIGRDFLLISTNYEEGEFSLLKFIAKKHVTIFLRELSMKAVLSSAEVHRQNIRSPLQLGFCLTWNPSVALEIA